MTTTMRNSLIFLRKSNVTQCFVSNRFYTETHLPPRRVDSTLTLHRSRKGGNDQDRNNPLVIMFDWLQSRERHIQKYRNIYLDNGIDVLNIRVPPLTFLRPICVQTVVGNALDFVQVDPQNKQPLLSHGFSGGGYMYGELLVKLKTCPGRYASVRGRMIGQICDSPVAFECMAHGFADSIIGKGSINAMMRKTVNLYLDIFEERITNHYKTSYAVFVENELELPSLMLFSKADRIAKAMYIDKVVRQWQERGVPVHFKCWEDSGHVQHFQKYPEEYTDILLAFLRKIKAVIS